MATKKVASSALSLAPVLDLNEATLLHGKLMGLRGQPVSIDASAVERCGTLCIQVLMAAARSWQDEKHTFTFTKVSDAFRKTTQLIGVNIDPMMAKEI